MSRAHASPTRYTLALVWPQPRGGCSRDPSGWRDPNNRPASPRKPLPSRGKILPQAGESHTQACKRRMSLAAVSARAMTIATQHPATQRLVEGLQQGEQKHLSQGGQQHEVFSRLPVPQTRNLESQLALFLAPGQFHGTITNDKFCMSRTGRLRLS